MSYHQDFCTCSAPDRMIENIEDRLNKIQEMANPDKYLLKSVCLRETIKMVMHQPVRQSRGNRPIDTIDEPRIKRSRHSNKSL